MSSVVFIISITFPWRRPGIFSFAVPEARLTPEILECAEACNGKHLLARTPHAKENLMFDRILEGLSAQSMYCGYASHMHKALEIPSVMPFPTTTPVSRFFHIFMNYDETL